MAAPPKVYRTIVAVEIVNFGTAANTAQVEVRRRMFDVLDRTFTDAGIDWQSLEKRVQGDGMLVLIPSEVPRTLLVDPLPQLAARYLSEYYLRDKPLGMRLRVAVHAGEVMMDGDGVIDPAVRLTFRLLDAAREKGLPERADAVLAIVVSDDLYREAIVHDPAAAPAAYSQFTFRTEETREEAWVRLVREGDPITSEDDSLFVDNSAGVRFSELDQLSLTLVRRAALLDSDETLDESIAAILLPGETPDAVEEALNRLLRESVLVPDTDRGGLTFASAPLRTAAVRQLAADEGLALVGELRTRLRQHRIVRDGIAPKPKLVRDYWTTEDRLDYRPYATAIAAFIRHEESKPPLTIGLKGPWGAGKTSLMRMVRAELDPPGDHDRPRPIELTGRSRTKLTGRRKTSPDSRVTNGEVLRHAASSAHADPVDAARLEVESPRSNWRATVWFNPWMYQSAEQVWAGLAHAIIGQVTDRLRPGDRERFWLELNLARIDRLAIRRRVYRLVIERLLPWTVLLVLVSLLSGVLWLTGVAAGVARWGLVGGTGLIAAFSVARYLAFRGERAITGFGHLLTGPAGTEGVFDTAVPDPGYAGKAGFLHAVHGDMVRVLKLVATEDRPLVVFVDDLDRCSPGVVAQVIEAINLFLAGEFNNCVFVLAMEPDVVAAHVEVAYSGLADRLGTDDRGALGWRFLEKIVQLPIGLPPIDAERYRDGYLSALLGVQVFQTPSPVSPAPVSPERLSAPKVVRGPDQRDDGPITIISEAVRKAMISNATELIRSTRPVLDTLPDVVRQVEREIAGDYPVERAEDVTAAVLAAADLVFAELYSDSAAFTAIEAALPALNSANPREIKRYVNLFRFYSFITFRSRVHGQAPSDAQLAKLAALAIRWPDLLGTLSRDSCAVLAQLEDVASDADERWLGVLDKHRCLVADAGPRRSNLRDFLAREPKIGGVAHGLL